MDTRPHSFLTVEENPAFRNLIKEIARGKTSTEVEEACSPEEAMKLINNNSPYSVIWSGYQFEKSKTNGLEFLKSCRKQSPLSSRILCSGSFDDSELKSLVKAGGIHSYYSKTNASKVIDSVSSVVAIGLENYRINLFDNFLSINRLTHPVDFDNLLIQLKASLEGSPDNTNWELEDRELELNNLLSHTQSVFDRFPASQLARSGLGKDDRVFECIKHFQNIISYMTEYLARSNTVVENRFTLISETNDRTAKREAKIEQLKAEFPRSIVLQDLFSKGASIPTLPEVFYRFKKAVDDPDSSFEELADVVASDPSLTTRLLKIVNSPIYWFSNPVETIPHAISVIGGVQMSDLVLTTCIIDRFEKCSLKGLDMHLFWEHGIACGLSAKILAKHLNILNPESLFVGGLIHDIGRLVICLNASDLFSEIYLKSQTDNISLLDAEKKLLGFDHAQVGEELLKIWKIPKAHQETVRYHHNPMEAPLFNQEAALVDIANNLSKSLGLGSSGELFDPKFNTASLEILGLKDESFFMEIREEIQEQYKNTVDSFLQ